MAASPSMPGVQPLLQRDQDATTLLRIFPEEIWQIILQQISSSQDYLNICRSSQYLQFLMQPFRTRVLFPDVVDTISTHLFDRTPIPKDFILTSRLICQAWKQGVNQYLRDSKQHNTPSENVFHNMNHQNVSIPFLYEKLTTTQQIVRFKQHIHNTYGSQDMNPFVCQSVSLRLFSNSESNNIAKQCQKLLHKYGQHVLHCVVNIGDFVPGEFVDFTQLFGLLGVMPNLKTLSIDCKAKHPSIEKNYVWYVNYSAIPILAQLECLRLNDMRTPIFNAFIRKNNHIRVFGGAKCTIKNGSVLYTESLPNLEELQLYDWIDKDDFYMLERSTILRHLIKLELGLGWKRMSWQTVFRILENGCSDTLKDLNISLPTLYSFENEIPKLNLPTVVNLVLTMEDFIPLDFILPLKNSLRNLTIRAFAFPGFTKCQKLALKYEKVVRLYGCLDCLMASNIWTQFSKLDSFRCYIYDLLEGPKGLFCSRHKWHCYNQGKN